ncbi:aromatic ring-hydroxylating dioxygenase subunit alpha [Sphingomonas ginsenosidivorax]|uniref:Aromatic ring-hydroxylating dioxygenase subunit alpha n=1 Tax=Sphingomonas ginsenosidivorax TaxID=862135 RepID=A0A5C6UD15_9SPHN|nr:aromatic ring-hydroxylating dioxygenase subunit alpha [Sphingomonas ginsenosidivorax]TXC70290.1 aromatic ring-hydroxylating dioxygenase subunit alpha [Sphingomonas ginsenosidivorax]
MTQMTETIAPAGHLTAPVTIPVDAYVSRDYAAAEQDRLWRKTWLQAGRLEDIPEVGNYITYDIGPDGVIVVRTSETEIRAYHNVCPHRGRRLIDVPAGQHNARGTRANFICGYHAWTFDLQGRCTFIQHQDDWQGALTAERTSLGKVQVDSWGGWIWINLDPAAAPLADYLDPVPAMLDPYGLQNMRPRWRKWIVFDCNWKVAMEAFAETYHVFSTHPEFNDFGQFRGWAHTHGLHTNIGYEAPKGMEEDSGKLRVGTGDARVTTAELQNFTWANANTNTTRTLVEAANRLVDELPEDTPAMEVSRHWIQSARATDAARGVIWPTVEPAHTAVAGTAWQVFPNFQIGQAVNNMLCYAAKPFGGDPDRCIFEAAVYELYPAGEEPATEWDYTKAEDWPPVLQQDFANMAAVQQGMKTIGFRGTQPNPYMERSVASLHDNLARFMGVGAPKATA